MLGTWEMIDFIRRVITQMQETATLPGTVDPTLLAAVADMLTYEADMRHDEVGAPRHGYAALCSCGGMAMRQRSMTLPCGRLQRAYDTAWAFRNERTRSCGTDVPKRAVRRASNEGRHR